MQRLKEHLLQHSLVVCMRGPVALGLVVSDTQCLELINVYTLSTFIEHL